MALEDIAEQVSFLPHPKSIRIGAIGMIQFIQFQLASVGFSCYLDGFYKRRCERLDLACLPLRRQNSTGKALTLSVSSLMPTFVDVYHFLNVVEQRHHQAASLATPLTNTCRGSDMQSTLTTNWFPPNEYILNKFV